LYFYAIPLAATLAIAMALNWQERNVGPFEGDWPAQHEWLAEKLELFDRVFRPRVKQLNADDWTPEPGDEESPEAA
jgi:hypothetical protein